MRKNLRLSFITTIEINVLSTTLCISLVDCCEMIIDNARNEKRIRRKITRQGEKPQSKFSITYNQPYWYSNRLPPSYTSLPLLNQTFSIFSLFCCRSQRPVNLYTWLTVWSKCSALSFLYHKIFEGLILVNIRKAVFRDTTPCILEPTYHSLPRDTQKSVIVTSLFCHTSVRFTFTTDRALFCAQEVANEK